MLSLFYLTMNWILNRLLKFTGTQKFLSIQLEITNACNLNCIHCYQPGHSGNADMSFEDWRRILTQYKKLAEKLQLSPHFCISGGEPTISPLFPLILAELHANWPAADIALLTNGTCLSEKILAELTRYNVAIQISIDGPDNERHDHIRGRGNFKKAMKGMEALKDSGLNTTFQAVLSARTAPWIKDFFETAKSREAAAMNFTRFVPQGKGKGLYENGGDRPLAGAALKNAYLAVVAASEKYGIPTATNQPLFALISPKLGAHGKYGFQGLVIDYQGNLKVSSRTDFRLGKILESGLEELFLRHPIMKELRDGNIEGCGACRFYDRCGGDRNAAYSAYGSFLEKDPGCWL